MTQPVSPTIPTGPLPTSTGYYYSIVYSPYNSDDSCKSASQVDADIASIVAKGIYNIRIYGTDCNSVSTVGAAVIKYGVTLTQGFYMVPGQGPDSIDAGVQMFLSWMQSTNSQSLVARVLVANEVVASGVCTASQLLQKVIQVKAEFQNAGYSGPVSTAETVNVYQANPSLCQSSAMDFVAANIQPYFDASSTADEAGDFMLQQVALLEAACAGKQVYVSEAGYPSAGNVNGNQVPTKSNQETAIFAMRDALNGIATWFTCYDDYWKAPGPYGVEQHFGILDFLP